jgi:hypothetical protein
MNYYYLYCCSRTEAAETAARLRAALAAGEHPRKLADEDYDGAEGWWRTMYAEHHAAAMERASELLGDGDEVEVISDHVLLVIIHGSAGSSTADPELG